MKKDFRLNRVFSTPISAWLLKLPITPNQVTLASLVSGLSAGFLFARGGYVNGVFAAFLYEFACVLDNCDGDIARAKNLGSVFGSWLDIGCDFITDVALFAGLTLGVLKTGSHPEAKLFLMLCLSGAAMHFLLVVLEKLKGFGPAVFQTSNPDRAQRRNPLFILFDALREGDASWLVVLLAILGQNYWLLAGAAVYMQILWVVAIVMNFKFLVNRA